MLGAAYCMYVVTNRSSLPSCNINVGVCVLWKTDEDIVDRCLRISERIRPQSENPAELFNINRRWSAALLCNDRLDVWITAAYIDRPLVWPNVSYTTSFHGHLKKLNFRLRPVSNNFDRLKMVNEDISVKRSNSTNFCKYHTLATAAIIVFEFCRLRHCYWFRNVTE